MHQSEKSGVKREGKISLVEFFTTLGLVVASGVLLSQDTKTQAEPAEKHHRLSIYEIKALVRDFESQYAPYRPE
ncbi:hypothetical protein EPO14_04130 [Patescibacteria group bacterium]|nr:MAG: hypothetical protein EPO14_04130 [Patescibacteria group bacterium]